VNAPIKSTWNNNNVGGKFLDHREEKVITSILVFVVSKFAQNILITFEFIYDFTSFPRDIDIAIFSFSFSNKLCLHILLVGVEWEPITSMERNVENLVIVVESFLGTISVVDVPIKNTNSLTLVSGVLCSNRNIIKNTKTRRVPTLCMVTRGTHYTISTFEPFSFIVLLKNGLNTFQGSVHCQACCYIALVTIINIICLVCNCQTLFFNFWAFLFYLFYVFGGVVKRNYFLF